MKKTILVALTILAVILIGAPFITGKIAETQIQKFTNLLNETPLKNGTNQILSYDRSIYSAESVYRYTLPPQFKNLFDGLESFDFKCELDHGVISIDYHCNIANSEAYTAFINDHFSGKDPISMHGEVSALGGLAHTISIDQIDDFKLDENSGLISISDTELLIKTDKSLTSYNMVGGAEKFSLVSDDENMSFEEIELGGDLNKLDGGLLVGDFNFSVGSMHINDSESSMTLKDLKTVTSANQNGENIDTKTAITIDEMALDNGVFETVSNVSLIAEVNGVNAQALIEYQAFADKLQSQMLNPDDNTQAVELMSMVPIIERMLVKGFNVNFDLSGKLDDEKNSIALNLELLEPVAMNDFIALVYAPQDTLKKLNLSLKSELAADTVNSDPNFTKSIQNNSLFIQTKDGYSLDLTLGDEINLNDKVITAEELQALVMSSAAQ